MATTALKTVRLSSISCSAALRSEPHASVPVQVPQIGRFLSLRSPSHLSSNAVARGGQRPSTTLRNSYLGRSVKISSAQLHRTTGHRSGGGALVTQNGTVEKVNAKELDEILLNERTKPIVIDFYATWCGPCIMLAQELKQLSEEFGDRVRFLKVDTDEETVLASQLRIQGLPTMVFVSDDKTKNAIRTEGLLSADQIKEIIEKEL